MHVWRFYLNRGKVKESRNIAFRKLSDKYPLYAITNDKAKAKKFMAQRNMKLFVVKDSHIEKEEWIEFCGRNRGAVLQFAAFSTRDPHPDKGACDLEAFVKEVNVLVTFNEKNDVEDYVSGEFGGILAPPSIQNAERLLNPAWCRPFVQVALEAIQYPTAYKFAVYSNDPHGDYSSFSGMYCGTRRFVIDELTVFIWNYGYLFK